jgi:hypothetical protein
MADQTQHVVSDLSYAGDEGGIVCHIVRSEEHGALVVSLTQVRVPRYAARCGSRRLSQPSGKEAKEAGSDLRRPVVAFIQDSGG